jgi:glutathione S-transferase
MGISLYELAGAEDERRFSPYCWRIRLALRHKGLPFDGIPWRFTEKDRIAFTGQGKVPVLTDGDRVVVDSWAIAAYLDETYADRPSLLGGPSGKGMARFITDWCDGVVLPAVFRLILADIPRHLHDKDVAYFRTSREQRVGMSLEAFCAERGPRLAEFGKLLAPFRQCLGRQPYLAGDAPAWPDYALQSAFQWARGVSPLHLLETDDPVFDWRERMLDAFDGEGRKALGYPV